MKTLIYALAGLMAAVAFLMTAPARAQTAGDINRLNQAVQICNSPMGAGMAECAKLRSQLGGGGGFPGMGGGNVAKAAGMASLLGGVMRGGATASAPVPAPSVGIDFNKALTNCVARAAGDQAQIQRCLAITGGGVAEKP